MKSQDNCADLGTKTLAAGTLSLLRNLNGLVDKNAMDRVPCGVRAVTISAGESRMLRATVMKVLERTLDEIARNNQIMSGSEKVFEALSWNSCMLCVQIRSMVGAGGSHHDVDVETFVESLVVHAHLPRLL